MRYQHPDRASSIRSTRRFDDIPYTSSMTEEQPAEGTALDRRILMELEPEAARLLNRHLEVAEEWFPHEYIPYRLGRDFERSLGPQTTRD